MKNLLTPKKLITAIIIGFAILTATALICAMAGTDFISPADIFKALTNPDQNNIDYQIFTSVRLPRVILAALVGAALAAAGVIFQALLRNPLADPYILGISSGAGLGAIIAIITGVNYSFMQSSAVSLFAFIGSLLTVALVWKIGNPKNNRNITNLLLAGVVVNAFFSAIIMFLTSIAKSDQLYSTIFWLMGNITEKSFSTLTFSALCILIGIAALFTICNKLNILSFGDDQAKNLGVNTAKIKFIAFIFSSLITAIAVSLTGLIGFVGLIVPHTVRIITGPDHRILLPVSTIAGAIFMILADTIARTIVAPAQLPVGVITAIAGGPFFLFLLAKNNKNINWFK